MVALTKAETLEMQTKMNIGGVVLAKLNNWLRFVCYCGMMAGCITGTTIKLLLVCGFSSILNCVAQGFVI